jgi:hypothetical protein
MSVIKGFHKHGRLQKAKVHGGGSNWNKQGSDNQ